MVDIRYPIETKESLTLFRKQLEDITKRLEAIENDPILKRMTVKDGVWEDSFGRCIKYFLSNLGWFIKKLSVIIDQMEPTRKRRANAKKPKRRDSETAPIHTLTKPTERPRRGRPPKRKGKE